MNIHPFIRIRRGALSLVVIAILSVVGFRVFAGYGWVESVWMMVITISTVGYSEQSDQGTLFQLFSILVILVGTTAAAYTFTGVIQLALQGELDREFGRRKMEKEIAKLKQHTIVCGFGGSGRILAQYLDKRNDSFLIIESDPIAFQLVVDYGYKGILADANDDETLLKASVTDAKAIVISLGSDAANVFVTLSARNLCPSVRIVAQAEQESTAKKLWQAGANEVVMGHQMVAQYMSRLITRPVAARFFSSLNSPEFQDLMLDELIIPTGSALENQSIAQSRIRDQHELLVVAIRDDEDRLHFNPPGNRQLQANETLVVMGNQDDVEAFQETYQLVEVDT